MKTQLTCIAKFTVAAVLAGSGLMHAAQNKFHLPVEARWGQAVLAPGDYSLFLPSAALGQPTVRVEAGGKTIYALPAVYDTHAFSGSSWLKLTNINGQYVVTELESGVTGRRFRFGIPKSMRQLTVTPGHKVALLVQVH